MRQGREGGDNRADNRGDNLVRDEEEKWEQEIWGEKRRGEKGREESDQGREVEIIKGREEGEVEKSGENWGRDERDEEEKREVEIWII